MGLLNIKMSEYAKEVKSRYITPFSYVLVTMGIFNATIYYRIYRADFLALACLLASAGALLVPLIRGKLKSHKILANYVILLFFLSINVIAVYTGGVLSNAIWWLGTIPLLASFLLNSYFGIVWFIIIMLNFGLIFLCGKAAVLPANILLDAAPEGRMIVSFSLNASLIFILCIFADLIREKAFNEREELKLRSFQLSQLASLGKLASGIAHEINNPLTVIRGSQLRIGRMIEGTENVDKAALAEYMLRIQKNISRIQEVTSLMRAISEKAADRILVRINVENLLKDVLSTFTEESALQKIQIETDFPKHELYIEGVYNEFFQGFFNLIDNAFFELKSSHQPEKHITIKLESNEHTICVLIMDNGRGVPRKNRDKIFDPFFTTKSQVKGKGLGLSFSFNIFTNTGGSLELLDSKIGSHFRVTFPVKN